MTWRRDSYAPIAKPSSVERKRKQTDDRNALVAGEAKEKAKVRRRDKRCRFPLCECGRIGLRLEVSHEEHKGMGGNTAGDRSDASIMFLLCIWRHQQGRIARGKGTLRPRYLTDKRANGPVAWEVDLSEMRLASSADRQKWYEVAREKSIGVWEPFSPRQAEILNELREMRI